MHNQPKSKSIQKTRSNLIPLATGLALSSITGLAQVDFQFDYTNATHFDATSMAALESAASVVENVFSAYSANIQIRVTSSNANNDTLASAGSEFPQNGTLGFGNRGVVGAKILSNGATDLNGGTHDGTVDVNFFHNWDFDDNIANDAQDFKSTMIHELVHAVGFTSSITQTGTDPFGTLPGNIGAWAPFDEFVADSTGRIIGADGVLNGARWNTASVGGNGATPANNGLYFIGPIAMAAFGGNPVPMFSPNPWEDGSSGSHLDDTFFTGAQTLLMNSATDVGPGVRTLSAIELGALQDIGFTAVPEPYEYSLVVGLALSVMVWTRRQRASHA